jgi:cbb3-type cytochrome oxidase cytochrome c subunit
VRAHALKRRQHDKKSGMGEYEVLSPIQFKIGETIYTDADLSKQMATYLEPEEVVKDKARAKAQADAEAKSLDEIKAKAKQWDDVQEELAALRLFVQEVESLPKELRDQVEATIEKSRAAAKK